MVSHHQPPISSALPRKPAGLLFGFRFTTTKIFTAILLLIIAGMSPVSADDTSCYPKSYISSLDVPDTAYVDGQVLISSTVTQCSNCQYHWRVFKERPYLTGELIYENYNPSFITSFSEAGTYTVDLNVTSPQPVCDATLAFDLAMKSIKAIDRCPANSLAIEIQQPSERSIPGETAGSFWTATTSKECDGCQYTWSLYRTSDEVFADPIPLASSNTVNFQGKPALQYTFTDVGRYKINVIISNPPDRGCNPNYYSSWTVIHTVEAPFIEAPVPEVPGPSESITINPATTTSAVNPTLTGTQPQVTNTVIPAATQPVGTIPQGTVQPTGQATARPAGTPAPAQTSSENRASGLAPVVTTGTSAESGLGAATLAAPMTTTKKSPGFALAGALCAGLLVLVMRRK